MSMITLVRMRRDGTVRDMDAGAGRAFRDEFGADAEYLEMPRPPGQGAAEFAAAFGDAVERARGEWIYFFSDLCSPVAGVAAGMFRRLAGAQASRPQGLVWAGEAQTPEGRREVFTEGFDLEKVETGKALYPSLADPAALLPFMLFRAAAARALARDLSALIDPVADIQAFVLASAMARLARRGLLLETREIAVRVEAELPVPARLQKATADFAEGRYGESLAGFEQAKFAGRIDSESDLMRCLLQAKLGRVHEANWMTRSLLAKAPAIRQVAELALALENATLRSQISYAAVSQGIDALDPSDSAPAPSLLFELARGLSEGAAILELGPFSPRTSAALAAACVGTGRRVSTFSTFRRRRSGRDVLGAGLDAWKAALGRYDLEEYAVPAQAGDAALKAWGEKNKADMLFLRMDDCDAAGQDLFRLAMTLVKTGGWVIMQAEEDNEDGAWISVLASSLENPVRKQGLIWGRKTLDMQAVRGGPGKALKSVEELWPLMSRKDAERTMGSRERFFNAYCLARLVEMKKVPGALVECGVWRGGCSAAMVLGIQRSGSGRHFWAFDSFQGLPKPTAKDGDFAFQKSAEWNGAGCDATEEEFRETLFSIAELREENVHVRKGWFNDTIPLEKGAIGPIGILRLDGDWYDSVMVCLEQLYDSVSPGGYVLIDDYGYWEGAKKATDEFRAKRGISSPLIKTDATEMYWMKTAEEAGIRPEAPAAAAPAQGPRNEKTAV